MDEKKTAWERLALVHTKGRPTVKDLIPLIFTDFFEMHGDRYYGDDHAIMGGIAMLDGRPVTVIGQVKGRDINENKACNFAMPLPEGYRKALRLARQAEKFHRPVVCFIDTPGAPGFYGQVRGAIAATDSALIVVDASSGVEAGTLQVDDGCQDALIAVASGAFVSGTGKVKALTLSDGAGFVVASGRDKRLSASGAASIGATGVVNILAEDVANDESLTVAVVDFNGTVAGTGNLSGWKVLVNGVEVAGNVYLKGRTLMAERNCGTVLIFR